MFRIRKLCGQIGRGLVIFSFGWLILVTLLGAGGAETYIIGVGAFFAGLVLQIPAPSPEDERQHEVE